MRRVRMALAVGIAALGSSVAHAGRSHYAWLFGAEVDPERGIELETWFYEENGVEEDGEEIDETYLWWALVVGVTDHVEFAVPLELEASTESGEAVAFERFGAEVRWCPDSPDVLEEGAFTTLVRGAVKQVLARPRTVRGEADIVVAWQLDRVHALVDVGAAVQGGEEIAAVIYPGAGVSVRVVAELRIGVEAFGEIEVAGEGEEWVAIGPNLGWTHGRFWLAAAYGIGVYGVENAPRVKLGVAL